MGAIWELFKQMYAYMAVVPIVPFLLVYFAGLAYSRDKKIAIRLAMDITTVLLIGIVAALFNEVFGSSFGFFAIVLVLLLGAGLLGNLQYRSKGEVNVKRLARAVWRIGFFIMGFFYLLLMAIGVGQSFWQA